MSNALKDVRLRSKYSVDAGQLKSVEQFVKSQKQPKDTSPEAEKRRERMRVYMKKRYAEDETHREKQKAYMIEYRHRKKVEQHALAVALAEAVAQSKGKGGDKKGREEGKKYMKLVVYVAV
jgi:hypothetical protein